MPLTKEQFQKALQAGFSVEEIAGFEQRKQSEKPTLQENQQKQKAAQENLKIAQKGTEPFSILSQTLSNMTQHPIKSIAGTVLNPATQTLTGKSIEKRADESVQSSNIGQSTQRPFDKNLGLIQPVAMASNIAGQIADQATTPLNYVGAKAIKPIAKVGGMAAKGVGKLFGFESGRLINSLIKPADKAFNFGRNPGQQVVKEGITANTMEDLSSKIGSKLDEAQKDLQTTLSNPELVKKIDNYSDAIKPIDDAIAEASRNPRSNSALITRLENAKKDLLGYKADSTGKEVATRDLSQLNPVQAVQLKRDLGDMTKWTKDNYADDVKANLALKKAYGQIKGRLEKNVPGIREQNDRLANLIDANIAVKKRTNLLQKSDMAGGLFEKGSLFTAGYGILTGNIHEALGGIGAFGIKKLMDSPMAKTHVAQWLNGLSKSDLATAIAKYPQLKTLVYKSIRQNGETKPTLFHQPFKDIK